MELYVEGFPAFVLTLQLPSSGFKSLEGDLQETSLHSFDNG
jgi:hypothetical protein